MIEEQKRKMIEDFKKVLADLELEQVEDVGLNVTEFSGTQTITLDVEIKK